MLLQQWRDLRGVVRRRTSIGYFGIADPAAVRALWKGLRADERASGAVAVQFARAFADCGAQDEARRIIEQTLDAGMDDAMVALYGRLDGLAVRDRLDRLEQRNMP